MGLWDGLIKTAMGSGEVNAILSRADSLITIHTEFNLASASLALERHADAVIKHRIRHVGAENCNAASAAFLKLGIYFANYRRGNDQASTELVLHAMNDLKRAMGDSIKPDVQIERDTRLTVGA